MKKAFKFLLATVLFAGAFSACDPAVEPTPEVTKELKLFVDNKTITANGEDKATFTVKYDGETITGAVITYGSETLEGNSFSTTEVGEYTFVATYEEQTSNEITVTVNEYHELVLEADKYEIYADNIDITNFTVEFDGVDVTEDCQFCDPSGTLCYTTPYFYTNQVGQHKFYAWLEIEGVKYESNIITIVAKAIPSLIIKASKPNILNNGTDAATFTVSLANQDVTADAELFLNDSPFAGSFSNSTVGEYPFYAKYTHEVWGELTSAPITLNVVDSAKSVFFFAMTGTWCGPCTIQKTNMKKVLEEYGDNIVQVQFQSNDDISGRGEHASIKPIRSQLIADGRFGSFQYIPTTLTDFREYSEGTMSETTIRNAFNRYIVNTPKTGMAVNSSISDGKVNTSVTVTARDAGDYSIGIFLVEDHIIAPQSGVGQQYDHTNVARQMGVANILGESIGSLTAGQTFNKTFSFDILSYYDASNLHLVVYTLHRDGGKMVMDNSLKVSATGSLSYE